MTLNSKRILLFLFILLTCLFTQVLSVKVGHLILKNLHETNSVNAIIKVCSGFVGITSAVILLLISRRYQIQQIIKIIYGFTAIAALIFFFFVTPYYKILELPSGFIEISKIFLTPDFQTILVKYWHMIIFYGLVIHWPSAMLVLFYGYTNDTFSFKTASKYYPLFGVFALILNIFLNPIICDGIEKINEYILFQYWYYNYGTIMLFFIGSSYLCYSYLFRIHKVYAIKDEAESTMGWKTTSLIGILAGFSGLIIMISKTVWKYNDSLEFPCPSQYTHHLSSFGAYSSIAALMTLGLLIFMSFCLEERLGKAWRNFYYAISFVTLILGSTFFFFTVLDNSLDTYVSPKHAQTPMKTITLISAGYQILISSIAYPIILSLKEVAIITIKKEYRFTSKLLIDLFFVKGFLLFGYSILSFLAHFTGSMEKSFPYLATIFFICSCTRFLLIYHIGNRLPQKSEA